MIVDAAHLVQAFARTKVDSVDVRFRLELGESEREHRSVDLGDRLEFGSVSLSATLGTRIRVGNLEGLATGLDGDGALRLRDESGQEHRILSGDVEPLS